MEYAELEMLWKKYDSKLDNLEKLNKKLLKETLLKKPKRKLNWYKFQSLYGFIIIPVVTIIVLHPFFTKDNVGWKLITGCVSAFIVLVYLGYVQLKSFNILKRIDLSSDSIIDSASRVIEVKKFYNNRWKHAFIYYPVLYFSTLLIAWNSFTFDPKTITFLIVIFIVTYGINIFAPKKYQNRIARLEKDILNLKEYTE